MKPAGIRSPNTATGRLKVLKQLFGELPVKVLEEPAVVNRLKLLKYGRKAEMATLHNAFRSSAPPSGGARRRRRRSSTGLRLTVLACD